MKLKIIIILLFCSVFFNTKSQETVFRDAPQYDLRLLIVPFDSRIYYNDATSIIAKQTGENHDEIMIYLRTEFNRMLNIALMDSCRIVDLLSDDTRQARQDISDLYSGLGYVMKPAMQNKPENYEEKKTSFFSAYLEKRRKEKEKQKSTPGVFQGEIVSTRETNQNKYVHIYFTNPDVLKEISRRRGVDVFLFINQFDIKGVYDPYMSGNPDLTRNFRVHFSMYDNMGNLLHGSYGVTEIPFYLDDKQKIVNSYFPEVIRQIIHNIEFTF